MLFAAANAAFKDEATKQRLKQRLKKQSKEQSK